MKVKLGPINLTYQGKASFIEKDEAAHKAVIDARGKDQRGNGTAAAVVTAKLAAEGSITRVDVLTDLNITGRPAQFGRGVMTDVGNKLLGQFADKLAAQLGEGDAQGDADRAESAAAKVAATAAGAVEEVAASAEQAAGEGTAAKKAAAAAKKTAAAADGQGHRRRPPRPRQRPRRPLRRRPPPAKAASRADRAGEGRPAARRHRPPRPPRRRAARRWPDGPARAGRRRALRSGACRRPVRG